MPFLYGIMVGRHVYLGKVKAMNELRITSPASLPNLGLSICPGKIDPHAWSGPCSRNLAEDIQTIRDWGTSTVVTLMEDAELALLHVANLGDAVKKVGMEWRHWPVLDQSALRIRNQQEKDPWASQCLELLAKLHGGEKIFVHCRGGLGRTGTLAARLLIENGLPPEAAILEVREARKGAIETREQEEYLLKLLWKN